MSLDHSTCAVIRAHRWNALAIVFTCWYAILKNIRIYGVAGCFPSFDWFVFWCWEDTSARAPASWPLPIIDTSRFHCSERCTSFSCCSDCSWRCHKNKGTLPSMYIWAVCRLFLFGIQCNNYYAAFLRYLSHQLQPCHLWKFANLIRSCCAISLWLRASL